MKPKDLEAPSACSPHRVRFRCRALHRHAACSVRHAAKPAELETPGRGGWPSARRLTALAVRYAARSPLVGRDHECGAIAARAWESMNATEWVAPSPTGRSRACEMIHLTHLGQGAPRRVCRLRIFDSVTRSLPAGRRLRRRSCRFRSRSTWRAARYRHGSDSIPISPTHLRSRTTLTPTVNSHSSSFSTSISEATQFRQQSLERSNASWRDLSMA